MKPSNHTTKFKFIGDQDATGYILLDMESHTEGKFIRADKLNHFNKVKGTPDEGFYVEYFPINELEPMEKEDLLEDYDSLPDTVKDVLSSFDEDEERYKECKRVIGELKKIGYTADYGLSGEIEQLRKIQQPTSTGEIVKYLTPFPDEDPRHFYVIKEIHFNVEKPRALIQILNSGLKFPPINKALVQDLIVV